MMNHVTLVGRLVRDPELKPVGNKDNCVSNFTIAIDNWEKNPDGSRTTSFIPCVMWGKSAESFSKYARKGLLVGVEGRLVQRSFDRKDGTRGSIIEINCDNGVFLEPKHAEEPKAEEGRKEPINPVVPGDNDPVSTNLRIPGKLTPEEQAKLNELLAKKG